MKTTNMIRRLLLILAGLALFILAFTKTGCTRGKTPSARERIGIYDSRAIAIAYAGSTNLAGIMKDLKARHQKARESGDTRAVARLEAEGKAMQEVMHQQGFGTAPVDDLLAQLADELPRLRQAADVSHLVSKWDQRELDQHPGAVRVDVTRELVDAFHPTPAQRQRAMEIQTQKPVKLKE